MLNTKKFLFIGLLFLFLPSLTSAAVLYMEPSEGQIGPGDNVAVDLKIDVGENCINTVDINLSFPQDVIQFKDIITGDSIINLWIDKPDSSLVEKINQDGLVHLTGGIPGGFCGRIPGDPGFSNIIARLVFSMPSLIVSDVERSKADVNYLESSQVYINDGLGTLDKLVVKGSSFTLSKTPVLQNKDWEQQIKEDKTAPEPFVIELLQSLNIFNGFYYITFYTTDKQSGLDRYEIQEVDLAYEERSKQPKNWYDKLLGRDLFIKEPAPWKKITMPYVLEDQGLKSIIRVKAIDKAGNTRLAEYIPPESMRSAVSKPLYMNKILLLSIVGAFVIITILLYVLIIKKRRTHAEEKPSPIIKK